MRRSLAPALRTASALALIALVAGAVNAVATIWPRTWVREFMAGPASGAGEKLAAVVQAAMIEVWGFLAIGFLLALVAQGLARLVPTWRRAPDDAGTSSALLVAAAAFFAWVHWSWLADDALAFLSRPQVVLLDVAGFLGFLGALAFYDALVRRLPWSPLTADACAVGSVVLFWIATDVALEVVKSGDGGRRDPVLLASAGVVFLAALPIAGGVARLLERPTVWVRNRLRRRPLLPVSVTVGGWALIALGTVAAAPGFELSPVQGEPRYPKIPGRGLERAPNVVYVTVDTLRADHLSCYGYPRPTSPFLDSIAREGTLCADATSAASWTKPATGTILTGLYPSRHGALYHGSLLHLPEGELTMAEAFRQANYVTAGFVANPNLKKVFAFDNGFDEYFDSPVEDTVTLACIRGSWFGGILMKLLRHQFNWNYENDITSMNRQVLAWLDSNHDEPFFLYVHYIDPHIPYDPPEPYRTDFAQEHGLVTFNDRKRKVGIDLYDGEIRYTDDGLKELVGALKEHGAWENTIFVLTSDHGEEFFEHGVIGHGFSLFQEVVHVPLILRGPGVPAGQRLEEPVQMLDVAATVLSLAGLDHPTFGDGTSFHRRVQGLEPQGAELLYMETEFGQDDADQRQFVFTGVRTGPYKLVLTERNHFFPPEQFGREALYDLATDPGEQKNLFHDEAERARLERLLHVLREHSTFLQEEGFRDIAPAALSPEVEAQMRALGYVGGE